MGLFSGRDNTAGRAAKVKENFLRQGMALRKREFGVTGEEFGGRQEQLREDFLRQQGQTEAGFDPFIDIGQGAARNLQQSSTAQGFNDLLSQITGGETFQALRDEQERAGRSQLAAAGLTGSGTGLQQISQISPQLALQLAGDIRGRQEFLSGQGLQGAGGRSQFGNQLTLGQGGLSSELTQQLGTFRQNFANAQAGNLVGIGDVRAQGIIGDAAAKAKRRALIGRTIGTIAGGFVGGPAGAKAGGEFGSSV